MTNLLLAVIILLLVTVLHTQRPVHQAEQESSPPFDDNKLKTANVYAGPRSALRPFQGISPTFDDVRRRSKIRT
jgi:hypothetical protein